MYDVRHTHKKFKTSTKSQISIKKFHKVIKFNKEAWLKPYIDMNTELKKTKNEFLKLMSNAVFRKTMRNVRKYRDPPCNN